MGGTLLIGIEDNAEAPPANQRVEPTLLDRIRKRVGELSVNVQVVPELKRHENGGEYIALTIPRASGVASTSDGRYFLRVGDTCRPIVGDEVMRLANERPATPWEEMTSQGVSRAHADGAKVASLCARLRASDRVKQSVKEKTDDELLTHYGVAPIWPEKLLAFQRARSDSGLRVVLQVLEEDGELVRLRHLNRIRLGICSNLKVELYCELTAAAHVLTEARGCRELGHEPRNRPSSGRPSRRPQSREPARSACPRIRDCFRKCSCGLLASWSVLRGAIPQRMRSIVILNGLALLVACRSEPSLPKSAPTVHADAASTPGATASKPDEPQAVASDAAAVAFVQDPNCPEGMVHIPGGTFVMGSDRTPREAKHQVTLSPYCIDRTEVTVAAYRACVEAGECKRPRGGSLGCSYDEEGAAQLAISCVDWNEADTYCGWAKKRLPTEAEWEFSARGTDGRPYPWGDTDDDSKQVRAAIRPAPVGSKPEGASPFGVLDMSGNVSEWVADWEEPYETGPVFDPKGPTSGEFKVVRGSNYTGGFDQPATRRISILPTSYNGARGMRCSSNQLPSEPARRND